MKAERRAQKLYRNRVREAFDVDELARIATMSTSEFFDGTWGEPKFVSGDPDDGFVYQDNGGEILGIAHLDTVQGSNWCKFVDTPSGGLILCPTLDDRLGVYIITKLLSKVGVKTDWLLTTGEETGMSTAQLFRTEFQYNWQFQFDRAGIDTVMYNYEDYRMVNLIREVGGTVGIGIFSDICFTEHLGCKGFNWGCGYQDYHSTRAHVWVNDMVLQVGRFMSFYQRNASRFLEHDEEFGPFGSLDEDPPGWDSIDLNLFQQIGD